MICIQLGAFSLRFLIVNHQPIISSWREIFFCFPLAFKVPNRGGLLLHIPTMFFLHVWLSFFKATYCRRLNSFTSVGAAFKASFVVICIAVAASVGYLFTSVLLFSMLYTLEVVVRVHKRRSFVHNHFVFGKLSCMLRYSFLYPLKMESHLASNLVPYKRTD